MTAQKTAAGTYDRTVTWDLTKSVAPASLTGYAGQNAGTSTWTVTATKNEQSSNFSVAGEIIVYNPNTFAVGFAVNDVLSDGTAAVVTCPRCYDRSEEQREMHVYGRSIEQRCYQEHRRCEIAVYRESRSHR